MWHPEFKWIRSTIMVTGAAFCLFLNAAIAQDIKVEQEISLSAGDVPENILKELQPILQESSDIKYYLDRNIEHTTYEIKLLYKKSQPLSIEYFQDGTLMDIEALMPFGELPEDLQQTVSSYFKENYQKYRLNRIQRQFKPEEAENPIRNFIQQDWNKFNIRYEIVARVKDYNVLADYQFLFDREKGLIEKQKVKSRSVDNLMY